jgi:hypothetical protein
VIEPEFRSTVQGAFARRSYVDLRRRDEAMGAEAELRRRVAGRHVEVASVTSPAPGASAAVTAGPPAP